MAEAELGGHFQAARGQTLLQTFLSSMERNIKGKCKVGGGRKMQSWPLLSWMGWVVEAELGGYFPFQAAKLFFCQLKGKI